MRAVIYVRVSTDGQERDGTSLESQETACREYARTAGWLVVGVIRDTASGYALDRPGMDRLRMLLRQDAVDFVLAHAVDRLSRNQNHIGVLFDEIEQAGAQLECVTEKFEHTPDGRFILAARAFIGEVERAKILERTTRGKTARAYAGKLPQATGKGIFGYRYAKETGRREIEPYQAVVVERIFARYAETRSFSAIARELNDAGIPAFGGGRWYPITIRSILTNETYTGRTVYRRTRRVMSRNPVTGKRRSRVEQRPEDEWIEIADATPRIVSDELWVRVQMIIADPERLKRRPGGRFYALSSRVKCGVCGGAMVGQTLTVKRRPFRYYRCRHAYTKTTGYECPARYVRADALEEAVWREIGRVLSQPGLVLQELVRHTQTTVDPEEVARLEREITTLREQEARLIRLFSLGEFDEATIREEQATLRHKRSLLEERLKALRPVVAAIAHIDEGMLSRACAAVQRWAKRGERPGPGVGPGGAPGGRPGNEGAGDSHRRPANGAARVYH